MPDMDVRPYPGTRSAPCNSAAADIPDRARHPEARWSIGKKYATPLAPPGPRRKAVSFCVTGRAGQTHVIVLQFFARGPMKK